MKDSAVRNRVTPISNSIANNKKAIKRSGFLFTLAEDAKNTYPSYLVSEIDIPSVTKEFITTVFNLIEGDPEGITDVQSIRDQLNCSRATVLTRIKTLSDVGLISEQVGENGRKTYTLLPVSNYEVKQQTLVSQPPALARPSQESLSRTPILEPAYFQQLAHGDSFSFFLAFSVLPSKAKKGEVIERDIAIGQNRVTLTVAPVQDSYVVSVMDYRVLAALIGILSQQYSRNFSPVPESVIVDVAELIRYMGFEDTSGGRRKNIVDSIERWTTTYFKISTNNPVILEHYPNEQLKINKSYHIISGMESADLVTSKGTVPYKLKLSFDSDFRKRLNESNILSVHPRIMTESTPFAIQLHFWSRRVSGIKDFKYGGKEKVFQLNHVFRELDASVSSPIDRASRELKGKLRKMAGVDGSVKQYGFSQHGYNYLIDETAKTLTLSIDATDQWAKAAIALNTSRKSLPVNQTAMDLDGVVSTTVN